MVLPYLVLVWLACVLSNRCKSLASPSSGNRPARETTVSVVMRNLKEVSGKNLPNARSLIYGCHGVKHESVTS